MRTIEAGLAAVS